MKTGGLKYWTANVGDEIQSIAADRIVGDIAKRFDREKLNGYEGAEKYNIVLNGWFSTNFVNSFPPSNVFNPVFFSFHLYRGRKNIKHYTSHECISYFKKHEPIGCRDMGTVKVLKKYNVDAFYSKCLTMTFPKRTTTPKKEKVFFVDAEFAKEILPKSLKNVSNEFVRQGINLSGDKFEQAKKLLEKYKNQATLIVTTRLHAALPCVAIGIPVILFHNPKDSRMDVVRSIGLDIYQDRTDYPKVVNYILAKFGLFEKVKNIHRSYYLKKLVSNNRINWKPEVLEIESVKEEVINNLKKMIEEKFK